MKTFTKKFKHYCQKSFIFYLLMLQFVVKLLCFIYTKHKNSIMTREENMKKKSIKLVSVLLSALMLVGTSQTAISAFGAEIVQEEKNPVASQSVVSPEVSLEAQPVPETTDSTEAVPPVTKSVPEIQPTEQTEDLDNSLDFVGDPGTESAVSFTWDENSGVLTITGDGNMPSYSSGAAPWNSYKEQIKKVIVKNGVTSIGNYSFGNLTALIEVSIADSVETIGSDAFSGCTSLKSIRIPDSVAAIGSYAFYNCTSLQNVMLSNRLSRIETALFQNCKSLRSISVPFGVTRICTNAFRSNTALVSAFLSENVTVIDNGAFSDCAKLKIFGTYDTTAFEYAEKNAIPFSSVSGAGEGVAVCHTDASLAGLILRMCSTEGEKCYSVILTDNDVNVVYGLDTEKTYRAEICSRNGIVFAEKNGVSFGDDPIISVSFETLKKPLDVSLELTDENGGAIDDYTVRWTDGSGNVVADTAALSERIAGETLNCEIALGDNASKMYQTPAKTSLTLSEDSDNLLSVRLERRGVYTLSGTVTDAQECAVAGAVMTAEVTLDNGKTVTARTTADTEGKYTLSLPGGTFRLSAARRGYFDKTKEGTLTSDRTENICMELLGGAEVACKIHSVRLPGSLQQQCTMDDIEFSVSLKDGHREIKSYTIQNDRFYFDSEDVVVGDVLQFEARDTSGVYGDAQATVAYSENNEGISLTMVERGVISASLKNTMNESNMMLLFDGAGKYLATYPVRGLSVTTGNLPAGNYSAVFMGEWDAAYAMASLDAFAECGMTADTDYDISNVTVKNGEKTEINDVVIPAFDKNKFGYLNSDATALSVNRTETVFGQYFVAKAEYAVKDEFADEISVEKMVFRIPENCEPAENGVTVDGFVTTDYTFENGLLTIGSVTDGAVVRVALYNVKPAEKAVVTAELQLKTASRSLVQPVGSASVRLSDLDWNAPYDTNQTKLNISGSTFADAAVAVYDNNVLSATGKANSAGTFSVPVELHNPFTKSEHKLYVVVTTKEGRELRSGIKSVHYDCNIPMLSKVYISGSFGTRVIDYIDTGASSRTYSFNPSKPTFTYKVEFLGDIKQVRDVQMVSTDSRGRTIYVPAVYDEETGMFVCRQDYTSTTIPAKLSVAYNSDYDETAIDMEALIDDVCGNGYDIGGLFRMGDYLNENPMRFWKSGENQYVLGIEQGEERLLITMTEEKDDVVTEYYRNRTLLFKNEQKRMKKNSENAAKSALRSEGYDTPLQSGNSFANAQITPFVKQNGGGTAFSVALADDDGNIYYNTSSMSAALENRVKSTADDIYGLFRTGYGTRNDDAVGYSGSDPVSWGVTDLWEMLTGDSSLEQWARYNVLMDLLEECYKNRGLNPDDIDKSYYRTLLTLSSVASAGNMAANMTNVPGYVEFAAANGLGTVTNPDVGFGAGILINNVDYKVNLAIDALTNDGKKVLDISGTYGLGLVSAVTSKIKDHSMNNALDVLADDTHRCQDEEKREKETLSQPVKGSIDPSGYICEAVKSNRVEGVTCTAFYSPYADGRDAVIWDASEYDQSNPLLSDSNGYYEWYVPEGYWQVRYEKDGYITAYSEWLPVPPPQTAVNIAMTSLDAPKIKTVCAYQNEIGLEFTQYMNIYTVTGKSVKVTLNGSQVSGQVYPANAEEGCSDNHALYASQFRFVPDSKFSEGDRVTVSVSGAVNYADNTAADFENEYDVMLKPETIEAEPTVSVSYKDTKEITIQIHPGEAGANRKITVSSSVPSVAEVLTPNVTADANGKATVKVRGVLPGAADIVYSLEDGDCTGMTVVEVTMSVQKVATVTSSVPSGSKVVPGTKIELSCATPGAKIYYTTDLTCPCVVTSESRLAYTTPIEIKEYTTIIAYAVKDGLEDSKPTLMIFDVQAVVPEIAGDTNGDGVFSISDVTYLQKYLADMVRVEPEVAAKWDFDHSGSVDISDATFMQKVLADLESF